MNISETSPCGNPIPFYLFRFIAFIRFSATVCSKFKCVPDIFLRQFLFLSRFLPVPYCINWSLNRLFVLAFSYKLFIVLYFIHYWIYVCLILHIIILCADLRVCIWFSKHLIFIIMHVYVHMRFWNIYFASRSFREIRWIKVSLFAR